MDPVDAEVGANIKMLRRRRGISQKALGDALGLTFQQVQKYENGKNRVGAGRLQQISNLLGVPAAALFPATHESDACADDDYQQLRAVLHAASTSEGLELIEAFLCIRSAELRRKIVALIEAIADQEY